jgi:hypothetical protein
VAHLELDVDEWAEEQFGNCRLGDGRRTKRAVKLAAQAATFPNGSTPAQAESWADCKATYRFFDADDVSFEALCEPHWQSTRSRQQGTWLLIGDTTQVEFGIFREVSGLGPTGDGGGRGFFLHSELMVSAETEEIVGLAGGEIFHRRSPPREPTVRRRKRARESEVWGRVIEQIGPPHGEARFIHVFDAGADNYEVICHLLLQQCGWVIRAGQTHRKIRDSQGQCFTVRSLVDEQPVCGSYELLVRARWDQPARTAQLEVRIASLVMPGPECKSAFLKQCGIKEIPMWVVEAREVNAPQGVEPLHWVLLTSEPITNFDQAWTVIGWYEKRPLIEEFHKCLKTGCRVEHRQYKTSTRLQRVVGLLSIVAVRLLQLKSVARTDPKCSMERVIPTIWRTMLERLSGHRTITTVGEFFRCLAGLGGFLGRKHDGEPGWMTIWRGLEKLTLCLRGHHAMRQKSG